MTRSPGRLGGKSATRRSVCDGRRDGTTRDRLPRFAAFGDAPFQSQAGLGETGRVDFRCLGRFGLAGRVSWGAGAVSHVATASQSHVAPEPQAAIRPGCATSSKRRKEPNKSRQRPCGPLVEVCPFVGNAVERPCGGSQIWLE